MLLGNSLSEQDPGHTLIPEIHSGDQLATQRVATSGARVGFYGHACLTAQPHFNPYEAE